MDSLSVIAFWAVLFLVTHLGMAASTIRPRLVAAMGEMPYRGVYSLVSFATFVPLAFAFGYHKHAGAMLWDLRAIPPVRWLVWLVMLAAITLLVAGLTNPSPASIAAPEHKGGASGVLKLTRHPSFVALSLFGLAHMLMNGSVGDLIFFGSFPAVGVVGAMHQDQRKQNEIGRSYSELMAETSLVPGAALLAGRQRWTAADTPWLAIVIGVALTALIVAVHPMFFGGFPLG